MSSGTFADPIFTASAGAAAVRPRRRIGAWLHAALLATAFCVFAWSVALELGIVVGALGTALGSLAAGRIVDARYRIGTLILGAVFATAIGLLLTGAVSSSETFAEIVTAPIALQIVDALRWASIGFGVALLLRGAALRFRAALAIEGTVVVIAVAATVAAHRDGMIARPLEVSDWFWTQGVDPVTAFLGVGLIGGILLAAVLAYGRSSLRTAVQLFIVLLIGAFVASQIHSRDPDKQRDVAGGKLEKDDDKRSASQGGGGKSGKGGNSGEGGGGQSGDSPFDDGLPKAGGGSGGKNKPTAIVVFHKDVSTPSGVFYFRHAAFSQFNGVRLIESTLDGVDDDVPTAFPTERRPIVGQHVNSDDRELVATDVALLDGHTRMFGLVDATEVSPRPNPAPARFRRAYHVVSAVITSTFETMIGRAPGDRDWSDEVWQTYTTLPRDERYHRLAAELQSGLRSGYEDDPLARALLVKRYLEESVTYSFKKNYDDAADPTAEFLFSEEKLGYCVHIAHAATYLMRAMGVPARVGAGYAVPAANLGGGSSLLIKNGDAHAWAEIFLEDVGWVPIEVSPLKTDVEPRQFGEGDLQQLLGEMARKEGRTERQAASAVPIMNAIKKALALLPYLLLLVIALAYVTKAWRLVAPVVLGLRERPRVAYRAGLDRLSAIGRIRSIGESRERFAGRVGDVSPAFGPLTGVHVGAALGSPSIASSAEDLRELTTLASVVGKEVRGSVPWWRWILGALNPVSWLWSR